MGYIFKKYEFLSKEEADSYINQLPLLPDAESENDKDHLHHIKRLGFLVTTPATYDDDMQEISPAVISNKYSVDMLWEEDTSQLLVQDWSAKEVSYDETWVSTNGAHTWFGYNFVS